MVQNKVLRPRGRPRAYDPAEALQRATETFWRAGYSATSLDDLSAAMGMNRPSLYGAFGDKRALYLAAIDGYVERSRDLMNGILSEERSLAESLRRVYETALTFYLPAQGSPRGCFLIGTTATEAATDAEMRSKLGNALRDFDRALEARIRRAISQGELGEEADAAALARVASAVLHSLAIRSRAGDSRASLNALIEAGVRLICAPKPEARDKTRKRAPRSR